MVSKAARKSPTKSKKSESTRKRTAVPRPPSPEKVLEEFTAAVKILQKGDFAKARTQFKAFLDKHPEDLEMRDRIHSYLAVCERNLSPRNPRLHEAEDYYNQGVFLLNDGDYEEAGKHLEKALSLESGNEKALYALACVHARQGRKEIALETLKEAIRANAANRILALADGDFEGLRDEPEFSALMKPGDREATG